MNLNYKLFFKYILFNSTFLFLNNVIKNRKIINLFITQNYFYFLSLHFKFSTFFYHSQLSDIFAYELPININNKKSFTPSSIVVYNFHNMGFQQRFFIFTLKDNTTYSYLKSITELFPNSSWLEREVSELHSINFEGKKDLRNLMLQYGDTSSPFRKSYPSIGTKEMFYDGLNDLIVQSPVSIQV